MGVYSQAIITGLANLHAEQRFKLCFRSQKIGAALRHAFPPNCSRTLLFDRGPFGRYRVFHGLNQRLPRQVHRAVVTFHDLFVLTSEYSTPEFRDRFAAQARAAAERADLIIAVSRFTADQVRDLLSVPDDRIRVVHHGVNAPVVANERRREPMILHTGVIQERKNLVRLVEAFEATPPGWKLVLAGATTGYGAEDVMNAVAQSARSKDIELPGYVDEAKLEEYYARASVFAFPSLDEGFGLPVLEAMARGIPVLTSNRSALPEVAGDAAYLIDPRDQDALTHGLLELCSREDLRSRLEQLGRAQVSQFSWETAANQTWSVYKELF